MNGKGDKLRKGANLTAYYDNYDLIFRKGPNHTKAKAFYRVCNPESEQGLWYAFNGEFTGLIHTRFNFCQNHDLKMDFDDELVGWLSAVETLEDLYKWFSIEDIKRLQEFGWYIHEYEVTNHKFYDRFQHHVICQKTSKLTKKIIL